MFIVIKMKKNASARSTAPKGQISISLIVAPGRREMAAVRRSEHSSSHHSGEAKRGHGRIIYNNESPKTMAASGTMIMLAMRK
jgi:hypothetical protein